MLKHRTVKSALKEAWISMGGYFIIFWISMLIAIAMVGFFSCTPLFLDIYYPSYVASLDNHWIYITRTCYVISTILAGFLLTGLKLQAINHIENKSAKVKQLFSFLQHPFRLLFIVPLLTFPFIFAPVGFIIYMLFQFADVLVIERNYKVIEALKASLNAADKNLFFIFLINFFLCYCIFSICLLISITY